jgi:hypothetical protein
VNIAIFKGVMGLFGENVRDGRRRLDSENGEIAGRTGTTGG